MSVHQVDSMLKEVTLLNALYAILEQFGRIQRPTYANRVVQGALLVPLMPVVRPVLILTITFRLMVRVKAPVKRER